MERTIRRIVVGVRSHRVPDPVFVRAADLARSAGAELHVVHARPVAHRLPECYAHVGRRYHDELDNLRDSLRVNLTAGGRDPGPTGGITWHVAEGSPEAVLDRIAAELAADLIVVGPSRLPREGRAHPASTAERTARRASVPLLLLRRSPGSRRRRVLVATDLSAAGADLCRVGMRTTHAFGDSPDTRVRVLLLVQPPAPGLLVGCGRVLESVARSELRLFLAEEAPAGMHLEARARLGEPAREIREEAGRWDARLVVLGAVGDAGPGRSLLGGAGWGTLAEMDANLLVVPLGAASGTAASIAPERAA
jgi:nucleotide-binding universal stress UspA family protein